MNAQSVTKEYKKKTWSIFTPLPEKVSWGLSMEAAVRKIMKNYQTYCRWAPSLGKLEATHQEVWGTEDYVWWKHRYRPTVFFGLYDLRDYVALHWHKGRRWVLWAGSDIRNLAGNFYETDGKLHKLSGSIPGFNEFVIKLLKEESIEHWVENEKEAEALTELGIRVSGICPSFLGSVDLPVTFVAKERPDAYLSSGSDRQKEYGFGIIESIAPYLPWITFNLYGAEWKTEHKNVVVHGRVPKEKMNEETARMQIGLRLNEFDGFSEIMAKAVLRGQYAIGKVVHPHIPSFRNEMELIAKLNSLRKMQRPNFAVRDYYRSRLNNYPWNQLIKGMTAKTETIYYEE